MEDIFRELIVHIKESINDKNAVSLENITEETVKDGIIDLFKKGQIDNVGEYFRKYRKIESIIRDCPVSCLLLDQKMAKYKSAVRSDYRRIFRTKGHFTKVLCMMFDRSESFIFTGGEDGIIKIWDVYSGRMVSSLNGHLSPIFDFVIDYKNKYLLSCDQSGTVVCWDIEGLRKVSSVSIGEQIDYLDVIYEEKEAEPLEQKKTKGSKEKSKTELMKGMIITNSGKILKITVGSTIEVETVLDEIEEGSFTGAATTRGKKMVIITGMWPFSLLLDVNDLDNRFYVIDTDDLLTSSIDISHNSLKFAISTYSSSLIVWEYSMDKKPTKSNIQTRKRFKGRDLEGCWNKSTIELEGMSQAGIYNTDIIYLTDDVTVVAVDTESNIRIINIETKKVILIEKEYKITGIIAHPAKNMFLTVEVNGIIKVIDGEGKILNRISTDVAVAGTIVMDSTGTFFYIADLDGYIYKYSTLHEEVAVPETEYVLEDFKHYHSYNEEQMQGLSRGDGEDTEGMHRAYEERNNIIDQILKICTKNDKNSSNDAASETKNKKYSALGEPLEGAVMDDSVPLYGQTVDKWIRSVEIASILQLQSEMITRKVFEKEFKRASQNIIVPESEEEETLSEENEDSSSEWPIELSDNSLGTDTESAESAISEDLSDGGTYDPEETSADSDSEYSEVSEGTEESESSEDSSVKILSKRRGRRQAARKAICPDDNTIYAWYMNDMPAFPILPQVQDELVLVRERIRSRQLKSQMKEEYVDIVVASVECLKTEVRIEFTTEKTDQKYKMIYNEDQAKTSPFVLKSHQAEVEKKRYRKNDEIYFYAEGVLSKGTVVKKTKDTVEVKTGRNRTKSVHIYDIYAPIVNYSIDLSKYLDALLGYKEDYLVFYRDVSKTEYPDYYEMIDKPMTGNKIIKRIKNKYYRTKEELASDVNLILSNCCKYNEEESEIAAECTEFTDALLEEIEE
ncbi:hypothetical protein NEMIN01_2204 [Nematocida minor]|uniref:uncharacterized protein n=1 Tax=Nematocida minor TaxID=1912983 RepID=UPI0022204AAF|nr:uncharacterized protein NEMIN01_2204 [Nematocida minor]KAI5192771.1 hypothetical protein NEMIN01_2204 [Nematocida minor]